MPRNSILILSLMLLTGRGHLNNGQYELVKQPSQVLLLENLELTLCLLTAVIVGSLSLPQELLESRDIGTGVTHFVCNDEFQVGNLVINY